MSLPFTALQCFTVTIIVFMVIGLLRGWRREVISLAFVLVGLLFLFVISGGQGLAHFIFVKMPVVIADILGQPKPNPAEPSAQIVQITTLVSFVVILALGYLIGNKVMPKPTTPAERILGVIPAVITGFSVIFFMNNFLSRNQGGNSLFTLAVETPNPSQYVVVIFAIAVVAVVIGLVAASVKKSGGA